MAEKEAVVVASRARLAEVLATWPDATPDVTWALCLIGVVPTAAELDAIREAARICDRVVVARLVPDKAVPPNLASVVRGAGGDILYVPQKVEGRLKVEVAGEKSADGVATLLVQALVTVLPNVVVVSRAEVATARLVRAVEGGLGEVVNIRFTD